MATSAERRSSSGSRRRRYRIGEDASLDFVETKCQSGKAIVSTGKMVSCLEDSVTSLLLHSPLSKYACCGNKDSKKRFSDSSVNLKNLTWLDDEFDSLYGSSQPDLQPDFTGDFVQNNGIQSGDVYSDAEITLPSTLTVATCCETDSSGDVVRESVSISKIQELNRKKPIPSYFSQIYHELSIIHQKLQQEKLSQQDYALKLEKRERLVAEREALLCRHEVALTKIRDVEEEVCTKFQIMKEQHEAEIQQLSEALKEKTKENKRLKSSFDTLKELNDTLKKQLTEVSEQNKKLEDQSRKVQARLENLKRKHEFLSIQKSKVSYTIQEQKLMKSEKVVSTSKTYKIPFNSHIYDLLTILMDWISDQHLSKLLVDEEGIHNQTGTLALNCNYTQEKCTKVLPLVAEQLQWMPFVNPNLHIHVVKFIYWSIRQLDGGMQRPAMTSTMRRLGEDLFKGVAAKGSQYLSSETAVDLKPKSIAFFKNSSLPLRFLSTLIIIKTVTQDKLVLFRMLTCPLPSPQTTDCNKYVVWNLKSLTFDRETAFLPRQRRHFLPGICFHLVLVNIVKLMLQYEYTFWG